MKMDLADAMRAQPGKPRLVGQGRQRLVQNRREQRPEVVARVRVVLPRRERGFARKTAEDQHARVEGEYRWQTPQARRCARPRRRVGRPTR